MADFLSTEPQAPKPRRSPSLTVREVRDIYVTLGRIDEKLTRALQLEEEVKNITTTVASLDIRVTKVEAFQGFIVWMTNGGWAIVAGAAYILTKLGVL